MQDDFSFHRDLAASTLPLTKVAEEAIGGANPRASPMYQHILNELVQDARAGKLKLSYGATSGGYANSRIDRSTAIAWFNSRGIALPKPLAEPATFEEAIARTRELTAALEQARSESGSAQGTSRVERSTLLMLAALTVEFVALKGPKFRTGNKPNIAAVAGALERRLGHLPGTGNASLRARLTVALNQLRGEGGDTQVEGTGDAR